tara:strand:+ start:21 stop:983 length:963 start_codon:yes stop_codon:yes gene_type:complete
MLVSRNDATELLQNFPEIKLSYVKNIHKKVNRTANIYIAIPKGKKYFVWFKTYKGNPHCFFLEIDTYKKGIKSIHKKICCFNEKLCSGKGTILYGTLFYNNNLTLFSTEDIFYFKGENLTKNNLREKLYNLDELFANYIKHYFNNKNNVIIGLPIIKSSRKSLMNELEKINYQIYAIQLRYFKGNDYFLNEKYVNQVYKKTFMIKADIVDDIYSLYVIDNKTNNTVLHGTAIIPDYKTSVMMNTLFRQIKENHNLDLLEESDDEEDFEDINPTKYIKDIKHIMECVYISHHKKWKPLSISSSKNISLRNDIIAIERNNKY